MSSSAASSRVKAGRLLVAALVCAAVVGAIAAGANGHGMIVGIAVTTLVPIVFLAVVVTTVTIVFEVPAALGYVSIHLIGLCAAIEAAEQLRPPWAWRPLPDVVSTSISTPGASTALLVFLATALAWELSYACTWLVVRERRIWLALTLIVGVPASAGQGQQAGWAFPLLSVIGLALAILTTTIGRRDRAATPQYWGRDLHVVRSSPWLRGAVTVMVAVFSIGLVAGAWATPTPSSSAVARLNSGSFETTIDDLLAHVGIKHLVAGDPTDGLTTPGGPLPVGGSFLPDQRPVFVGRVDNPTMSPYWRSAVYDDYRAGTWRIMESTQSHIAANAPLPSVSGGVTTTAVHQHIRPLRPFSPLVTAGYPLNVGAGASVSLATDDPGAGVLALSRAGSASASTYDATSSSSPTGPVTPPPTLDNVLRTRDLALPPLPDRVRTLALTLTASLPNAYDRAWALQRYFHGPASAFKYDVTPLQAPGGVDPVDFFLFTSHQGFCTHFAAAMVVLARNAGIPARLVTGYAAGRLRDDGTLLVRTSDAHAWPELWIADRGWVTFEPTPNFPIPWQTSGPPPDVTVAPAQPSPPASPTATSLASVTPATPTRTARPRTTATVSPSPTTATAAIAPLSSPPTPGSGRGHGPWFWPTSLIVVLVAIVLLAVAGVFGSLAGRRRVLDPVLLYGRMTRLAGQLDAAPRRGQTPLEWASAVASLDPESGAVVQHVTALYMRSRYGRRDVARPELFSAYTAWRRVRLRWLRRLFLRKKLIEKNVPSTLS